MDNLDMNRIPEHIAIIMDGNGRWATDRGKDRSYGHQAGVDAVRCITSECTRLGVKYLTLYTFSTENWNRPADEISALMGLVLSSLEDEIFMKNNVRFQVIGDVKRLPQAVQDKLQETMDHTAKNDAMTMVVALSYSSRWLIWMSAFLKPLSSKYFLARILARSSMLGVTCVPFTIPSFCSMSSRSLFFKPM